jgi:hypothetical protein
VVTDALDANGVRAHLAVLVPMLREKRKLLKKVKEQIRAESRVWTPKGQTPEHRYLESLTHTPWGTKVTTTFAQELSVSGFMTPDSAPGDNDPAWSLWAKARMPLVEDLLVREAFQYGESFAAALPSDQPRSAVAKPLPPFHTVARYEDPVVDVWPVAVLATVADRKTMSPIPGTLYVADWVYNLKFPDGLDADTVTIDGAWQHRSPQTPVVRFLNEIDSEGRTTGKIAPLIPLLERIRKDTYDRMLIQHKSSWKVRTIAGLEPPNEDPTQADLDQEKLRLSVEDILVSSNPEAKFGTLDESPLGDLIKAKESDVYEVCAISPIPPSAVMPGNVSNVSAEAIAELRNGFENRVADHKEVLGESFGWLVRALAVQARVPVDPESLARIHWQDRSVRSLAQAMDAWGKGATMLGIPEEMTWGKIPGVTQGEVQQWMNYRKRIQGLATAASIFQQAQPPQPAPAEQQ